MLQADPTFARKQILGFFTHAELYLLLGASITTVGAVAALLAFLRRRRDPVLLWFSIFAGLYGVRLVLGYQLLWFLHLHPTGLQRLLTALELLVPIPAFFFFRALDLFEGRGRRLFNTVWPVALLLAAVSLFFHNSLALQVVNNLFVIVALLGVTFLNLTVEGRSHDLILIRRGLLCFIACAIFDNVTGLTGRFYYNIEPFSFLILLLCLGIVAGRRALANEQRLGLLQKELDIARQIQLSILPTSAPASPSFQVTARYLPMTTVAGDFYDFLLRSPSELGLLIADVSGHGIPAALIASMVKLAATSQRGLADRPDALLSGINQALLGNTQSQFVTAGYVYLNATTPELRYAAAAHPPMLLLRGAQVVEVEENGLMLAAFSFAEYSTRTLPLQPGDRLLLYTDGIVEAANQAGEEFGAERLRTLLLECGESSHAEAADRIVAAVQHWSADQGDDLTVIVCDYLASPTAAPAPKCS